MGFCEVNSSNVINVEICLILVDLLFKFIGFLWDVFIGFELVCYIGYISFIVGDNILYFVIKYIKVFEVEFIDVVSELVNMSLLVGVCGIELKFENK